MTKYLHFALSNLFLTNGYREIHTENGIEREYEREEELEQCIRRLVLRKPEPLRGWDLRFLRRGLDLSQENFGKMTGKDAQTVARWEKSAESVPKLVDMMIRARFAERFEPQIGIAELLSFSDELAPALPTQIQLSLTKNGWDFNFEPRTNLPSTTAWAINSTALPSGHGPVQMVGECVVYVYSDRPTPIEKSSGRPSHSVLLKKITTSGSMPALLPRNITHSSIHSRTLQ